MNKLEEENILSFGYPVTELHKWAFQINLPKPENPPQPENPPKQK
jgi:hypothetical protein